MNKRALMLSAAVAALLTTPAMATPVPGEITTVVTKAVKTSTANDTTTPPGPANILIDSSGGIKFGSATVPTLTIDSSNTVNNGGIINASGQDSATAIQINAAGLTGGLTNNGTIDLSGDGTAKTAIHLDGISTFTGIIDLDSESIVHIVGANSVGLLSDSGSTLNGDWLLDGTFSMQNGTGSSSTSTSTTASGLVIGNLQGITNGNIVIAATGAYSAIGAGATGFNLTGAVNACAVANCSEIGTFSNSGAILVEGILTRSSTATNPNSGSAIIIGNNLAGGFVNNGPTSIALDTTAATISGNGITGAPVVFITPGALKLLTAGTMTIGKDTTDSTDPGASFINRGSITAVPEDSNLDVHAVQIAGAAASPVVFSGDFVNSGTITAQTTTATPQPSNVTVVSATALEIDDFTTIPTLHIATESTTGGAVSAVVSGPLTGGATAIFINGTSTHVGEIDIDLGATVVASVGITDPSVANVKAGAFAIDDASGSVATINNKGTISAFATTLTNGLTAQTIAVSVAANTTGVDFENSGTVNGDVEFGAGNDTYHVSGTSATSGASTGTIDFGHSIAGGRDFLHLSQFSVVKGTILSEGTLDVQVDVDSELGVQNAVTSATTALQVRDFTLAGGQPGSTGTLDLTVTQGASQFAIINANGTVTFGSGAALNVKFGSLLTTSGQFQLISAPTGNLDISNADVQAYSNQIGGATTKPFLLEDASITKVTNYNNTGRDVLLLTADVKTAAQLGLTGDARALFPLVNAAVARDPTLGAALVAGINSNKQAQAAYDAFAPDVSGGVRQVAISLTDQATGVVAARLHDLRLFDKEPGELTLWGNEFGQYFSTKGGHVNASANALDNTSGSVPGFKDHGFGFSLGLDEGSPAGGWYGAAFSFYSGDVSQTADRDSKTSTLWYMLTGYSNWRGKGLFVDAQVNVGYGDFKGKRILDLTIPNATTPSQPTAFLREADSKRAGLLASLGVTVGAMMKYGALTAIPQLSIDGMSMREEGFTETGGGAGMDLRVTPYYANSLRAFLGTEFRTSINTGDFFIQPSARVGYRFDFLNDPVKLKAQFATDPNNPTGTVQAPFTLQGPDPSQGNLVAGAGINATTEDWTIGLHYDFVRGSNNATEQVGTLSLLGRI